MDGLSLHISKVVEQDQFQALKIGNNINISHVFFFYDVLIMGMSFRLSSLCFFHIFRKFINAASFCMNAHKSILCHDDCDLENILYIKNLFGIEAKLMDQCMDPACW